MNVLIKITSVGCSLSGSALPRHRRCYGKWEEAEENAALQGLHGMSEMIEEKDKVHASELILQVKITEEDGYTTAVVSGTINLPTFKLKDHTVLGILEWLQRVSNSHSNLRITPCYRILESELNIRGVNSIASSSL